MSKLPDSLSPPPWRDTPIPDVALVDREIDGLIET